MSIVFQKSGLSDLTFERGRIVPFSPEEFQINQDNYLTESNSVKVIDYGDNLELLKLSFKHLSKDNYDGATNGLKTWFESTQVNWMANSFTMVDERGVSFTVRLWQKKWNMVSKANGRYELKLLLKKE